MESRSKCQKLSEEVKLKEAEDRINNLPRRIVRHILSFLPTKFAVGTSILSTKWKHMWTSIRNLENGDQWKISFMTFVYHVLLLLEGSNVNKFRIRCFKFSDVLHVNAWVTAALSRNVRERDIYIHSPRSGLLPADHFTCNRLVSLKTLHLGSVRFRDDESAKRLLSRCPVLEVLVLQQCGGKKVSVLSISAPVLKSLNVPPNNYKYRIELNTPNLPHLEYRDLVAEGYAMKNLSSLVKAHIDLQSCWGEYKDYYQTSVTEFFQGISTVRTLHMSGPCVEVSLLNLFLFDNRVVSCL
ncbi:hypothetical protein ACSBR2_012945 [Camellia fascicularis]